MAPEPNSSTAANPDYAALADALEEDVSTTWEPEPGDSISGVVATIEANVGRNSDSTRAELECNGDYVLVWLSTVLQQEFKKQRIQVGDRIGVKYFGLKVAEKSGREFKSYVVKVFTRGAAAGDDVPF